MVHIYLLFQRLCGVGLPWWCSGWEAACQCRGHRFEPWSGKIPHAVEQLGPWATITEPACPEPVLRNKRGRDSERPAHRDEEWPPLAATRESPRTETKTQHSHKKKKKKDYVGWRKTLSPFVDGRTVITKGANMLPWHMMQQRNQQRHQMILLPSLLPVR